MLAVPPEAGRSGAPSTRQVPTMTLPAAVRVGPAGVATGFPQTPEGAVAQLAAIETTVLQNMSCLLYTSDAADERSSVDLGGRRII